jgi:hypothetical protein
LAHSEKRVLRLLWRGVLAALSLGVALVCAELVVRELDPFGISYYRDTSRYINEAIQLLPAEEIVPESRIFQNRPGVHLELRTFDYATDELGLRCPAPGEDSGRTPPDAKAMRILFLGDSVTLAWGVDDRDSWIRLLERRETARDGRPLTCLNAGHLQYNTVQEADLFEAFGAALRPEAVVLTFVSNDVTDDPFDAFTRLMQAIESAQAETGLDAALRQRRARLTGWFWGLRGVLEYRRLIAQEPEEGEVPPAIEDVPGYAEGWARCRSGLERILAKTRELGVPLVVLDHGKPRIAAVRAWCEASGVPWYDFTFTDEEWAEGLRNSGADAHANPRGNERLYEKARAALLAEGWLRTDESAGADGR